MKRHRYSLLVAGTGRRSTFPIAGPEMFRANPVCAVNDHSHSVEYLHRLLELGARASNKETRRTTLIFYKTSSLRNTLFAPELLLCDTLHLQSVPRDHAGTRISGNPDRRIPSRSSCSGHDMSHDYNWQVQEAPPHSKSFMCVARRVRLWEVGARRAETEPTAG